MEQPLVHLTRITPNKFYKTMSEPVLPINKPKGEKMKCDECDCDKFELVFFLERYNKLLIGADKDQVVPLQVFACANCGHVNEYFLPSDN